MKKVIQFIHSLNTGGAETLVKEYALKLNKYGYDVTVLCLSHCYKSPYEPILNEAGIKVVCVNDYIKDIKYVPKFMRKILSSIQRYFYVRRYIRSEKPDVLHIHLQLNSFVRFAKPCKPIRIYYTVHSEPRALWFNGEIKRKKEFEDTKWLVKHYNMRFIALHDKMKEEIDVLFSVNNTIVLNNGIDFEKFEKKVSKSEMRDRLDIPQDSYVIGHVGRFSPPKNHEFLIKLFANILKIRNNSYLLMVGNGSERKKIEKMLEAFGIGNDKFQILENRDDIPNVLQTMDVFVFPSYYEGLGIVLIEAQKVGLRCVVSDTVPIYVEISNLIKWRSLKDDITAWVDNVLESKPDQDVVYYGLEEWDMKNVIKKLHLIYSGKV